MSEPSPYFFLTVFLGTAIAFPLIPIGIAFLWSRIFTPPKPGLEKLAACECGIEASGSARIQSESQYYLYGLI